MKKKQLAQADAKRRLTRNFFIETLRREDRATRSASRTKGQTTPR